MSAATTVLLPGKLPPPPADLTETQAAIWRDVVKTKPAEWFTADSWPILRQFCCHVEAAMKLNKLIDDFPTAGNFAEYIKLLSLRDRESRIIEKLATSMRLTQQSRYKNEAAATAANNSGGEGKPWTNQ